MPNPFIFGNILISKLTGKEIIPIDDGGGGDTHTTISTILALFSGGVPVNNPVFTGTIDGVNLLLTGTAVIDGTLTVGTAIVMVPTTFVNLPIIPTGYSARAFITDGTTGQFGAIVSGGGDYRVPVYWDNGPSVWRVG